VRQQVQATQEITQSLSSALQGAGQASSAIEELNQAAEEAGQVSNAVNEASSSLSKQADQMKTVVETFLQRAATL
jgi:methyl-accepting chemotaxis protein